MRAALNAAMHPAARQASIVAVALGAGPALASQQPAAVVGEGAVVTFLAPRIRFCAAQKMVAICGFSFIENVRRPRRCVELRHRPRQQWSRDRGHLRGSDEQMLECGLDASDHTNPRANALAGEPGRRCVRGLAWAPARRRNESDVPVQPEPRLRVAKRQYARRGFALQTFITNFHTKIG